MGIVVIVFHGAGKERLPVAQGEKEFLVVVAGVVAAIDVDEAELSGVGTFVQVVHRHGVRVVPAGSGRAGRELETAPTVGRHERGALLFGAVDFGRNEHAVPVDQFRGIGVVDDVDGDRFALAHSEDRPGRGAVVADGRDDV